MHHFIYKTTCIATGEFYVGMHSSVSMNDGYLGSGKRLRASVKKHGKNAHVREILKICSSRSELDLAEKQYVTEELIQTPLCMNLALGGRGGYRSAAGWEIPQIRTNIINSISQSYNKSGRREQAVNIAKEKWEGESTIRKAVIASNSNRWLNEEFCKSTTANMSKSAKLRCSKENPNPNWEKAIAARWTQELRKKQSDKVIGTKWMNDGKTSFRVKPDEVEDKLQEGLRLGRALI